MIVYCDILGKLKACGYSTYRLLKENLLSQSSIQQIREGKPITTETINTICRLCDCQPADILKYQDEAAE